MADRKPNSTDPNHVPEAFCAGPVNLWVTGPIGTLTFSHLRKPADRTFEDVNSAELESVIRARVVLPVEGLVELAKLINSMIQVKPGASGSAAPN